MAFTRFTNATPLTLQLSQLGSTEVLSVLAAGDEVTLKTPLDVQFRMTDVSGRVTIRMDAVAASEYSHIWITDDKVAISRSAFPWLDTIPGTDARYHPNAAVPFVNMLPRPVAIQQITGDGAPIGGAGRIETQYANIELRIVDAAAAFRVNGAGSAPEKLDFVLADDPRPQFTADRYKLIRPLLAGDPSVLEGRYDVVKSDLQAPDPADTKYIRYGHQTLESDTINGWKRPVRRVTISGVDLVFDAQDNSKFLSQYNKAEDIGELWIHADTVVVSTALHFPSTDVSIYCRALQFEGPDAYIDATPLDNSFREPLTLDGINGAKGGSFTVYTSSFQTDRKTAKHFRSCGSKGQDPDEGGVEESKSVRTLEAITEAQWNSFFSADTRKVRHEEVLWMDGYMMTMAFPDFQEHSKKIPNIVFIEIKNSYYLDNFHINKSGLTSHRTWGSKEAPGRGGNGKRAGKPGTGGAGGDFNCLLETLRPYVHLAGGASGKTLGPTPGGTGGTPSPCSWLLIEGTPDGDKHNFRTSWESKQAQSGSPSAPGPPPDAPTGPAGKFAVVSGRASSWVSPINLNVAIQFARDACASGHADYATALLFPYVKALGSAKPDIELGQSLREAREVLRLAANNVDFLGKPPGWVPTLSLQSAAGIYDALLPQAMQELYTSYYIERVALSKQNKQKALQSLSGLVKASSEKAKGELVDLRKKIGTATDELNELLLQLDDVQVKSSTRLKALREKADKEAASAEQKEAIAAALKITGAVIKAIPLPEPYQTAASGIGSLFNIAGGFVEGDATDAAFDNLKTEVTAFTESKDSLGAYAASLGQANLDVSDLEKQAASASSVKAGLEDKYGTEAKLLTTMKEKRKAVYDAQQNALVYGRAKNVADRKSIVKKAGLLASSYEDDVKKLDGATKEKVKEYLDAQAKVTGIESEIASKKADFDLGQEARDKKAEENKAKIAARMKQVQNVANSVASIAATIKKLNVSRSMLNDTFDKAIAKLAKEDQEYSNICDRIKFLNTKKETVAGQVAQLTADIIERTDKISKNMLVVNEIAGQISTDNESLDANALAYIQSVGQDAHLTLTRFLYYTAKAFEYYMVEPWGQSYLSAQKFFDDLRRVLAPSDFKLDSITDPTGDEQKKLEAIIKSPDPRKEGMLTPAEFALLKTIYEKPLLDMGRKLADELMQGNSKALKERQSTVTLTPEWLADLNARILSPDLRDQVYFNLADLGQIDRSAEKQRISNIRVISVEAIKRDKRFPDTVVFIFEHLGKSIVRSEGRLFAFDPQSTSTNSASLEGSGVSFITSGGKSKEQPVGWVEKPIDGKVVGRLNSDSLAQAKTADLENLFSKLMRNPATLSLSQFRPGAFSDFLLRVDISPAGCKLEFTEIVLEISYEGGTTSHDELLVCVRSNLDMEVPISTSVRDMSGRHGASGRYIGVFNHRKLLADGHASVRIEVPEVYGRYELKGWELNGSATAVTKNCFDVSKDAYIVANYQASTIAPAALAERA